MPRFTPLHTQLTWRRAAPFIAGAAVIGLVIVVLVHAAGPLAAFEPESGTLSGGATLASATGQSGTGVVKFAAPTSSPTPSPSSTPTGRTCTSGRPDASCTGVPTGTSLAVVNGDQTYSTTGQVIDGKDIHGYVTVTGKNITIKNSIIRGGIKTCTSSNAQNSAALDITGAASGVIFEDSEIAPSNATACEDGIWATNITILRANIHGSVDGIKGFDGTTVQDSWIHDLAHFASDPNQGGGETHNDAIQSYECNKNILVSHSNLDLSTTTGGNAAYQITADSGKACQNIVIDSNWLDGGGCTINVGRGSLSSMTGGVAVTNNRFGRHRDFSGCVALLSLRVTLDAYTGNVYDDTSQPAPAPQQHD